MNRDDFQWLILALLALNLGAIWVLGELVIREGNRPPRIIRIYEGGRREADERSGDAA